MNDNQRMPSPSEIAEEKPSASMHGETQQASRQSQPSPSEIGKGQEQQQAQHLTRSRGHGM